MTTLFSPLVERAMRFAARQHRDHCRKASDLPYISHPASVALILSRAGIEDDDVLAAALLHDVVEDCDCTLDEIEAEFSETVREYVEALTETKHAPDGRKRAWLERKQEHVEHVGGQSWQARAIVLADKLHNLGTMLYDVRAGEEIWPRFGAPPARLMWYYTTMIDQAAREDGDGRLAALVIEGRRLVAELERYLPPPQD